MRNFFSRFIVELQGRQTSEQVVSVMDKLADNNTPSDSYDKRLDSDDSDNELIRPIKKNVLHCIPLLHGVNNILSIAHILFTLIA